MLMGTKGGNFCWNCIDCDNTVYANNLKYGLEIYCMEAYIKRYLFGVITPNISYKNWKDKVFKNIHKSYGGPFF